MSRTTWMPSASKLALAAECLFPWRGEVKWPKDKAGAFAPFGRAVSVVSERQARGEPVSFAEIATAQGLSPAETAKLAVVGPQVGDAIDSIIANAAEVRAEVAIAYDCERATARWPRSTGPRDYSDQREGELFMTEDLVAVYRGAATAPNGDYAFVIDWKTGMRAERHAPRDTPQLRALGLAAARLFNVDRVVIALGHVDEDGVRIVSDELTPWDLAETAGELRALYRELRARRYEQVPKPGPWCKENYCPILADCPATVKALAVIDVAVEPPFPLVTSRELIQSDDHAAFLRVGAKRVRERLEAIEAAARDYVTVNGRPVHLGGGLWYGPVQHDGRESVDVSKPEARAALERHLGEFGASSALTYESSKTAIKAACRTAAEKGKAAALERALLGELRELGAVRQGAPYVKVEEFQRKEEP